MSLFPLFQGLEDSAIGQAFRNSAWLFPVTEAFHLLGLGLIGGALLIVDMRLLGLGLRNRSTSELAQETQPWLVGSLVVLIISGTLLFLSESVKCYFSLPFRVKMVSLALAITFTFTVRRRVVMSDQDVVAPSWSKLVALISLTLWAGVAWGGRWIGFSG